MRTFTCQCGNRLHFENTVCLTCGTQVAFDPVSDEFVPLNGPPDEGQEPIPACAQREIIGCNWIASPGSTLCTSCAATRTVPNLDEPANLIRLRHIESAKRRMMRTLVKLGLWGAHGLSERFQSPRLVFDLLEPLSEGPVVQTGHAHGTITLNISEADDYQREKLRDELGENYRTLLGHFRHEVGHYFWDVLVKDLPLLEECRSLFGDETQDYQTALDKHYREGPRPGWQTSFISAYATMHPWEDWAETWAHFMHRHDTLETSQDLAISSSLPEHAIDPSTFTGIAGATREEAATFATATSRWFASLVLANELSRSMGQPDVYPFAPSGPALVKMFFIERLVSRAVNG